MKLIKNKHKISPRWSLHNDMPLKSSMARNTIYTIRTQTGCISLVENSDCKFRTGNKIPDCTRTHASEVWFLF